MKSNKGLSLIVLIITIIVVIILASVVILTISKNNPIESAKEARFKEDIRSFQDELAMYISSEMVKDYNGIREKITTSNMPSTDEMKQYIASFSKKYEHKLGIYNDELVYYIPDEDENVTNKLTDQEEYLLKDLGIKERVMETPEELFEWGSNDPNNPAYYTLVKYNGTEENVIIPQRCKVLGDGSIYSCFAFNRKIKKVKVQEGVTYIDTYSFKSCLNLEKVILPDSLKSIGNFAFDNCEKLKEIEIPSSVTYISTCAFASCRSLSNVILHEGLTGIGNECFEYCPNLKNIKLPDSLTYISESAFKESGLESINIPRNCNSLSSGPFAHCSSLKEITVDENNNYFISIDNVLYSKDKKKLIQYPAGKEDESYNIFNETEIVGNRAFMGNSNLKLVNLGNSVRSIGEYSFMYCSNLENINFSSGLKEIKYNCFGMSPNLKSVYIPSNVLKIESIAFWNTCETINCQAISKPDGWANGWCDNSTNVNWGVTN